MEKTSQGHPKSPNSSTSGNSTGGSRNTNPPSGQKGLAGELSAISHRDLLQDAALSVLERIAKYKFALAGILALAFFGYVGWIVAGALQSRTEMKAQNALFNLEKQYSEKKEQFDRARFAELSGQKLEGLTKASGDLTKDYGGLIEELEGFATTHKGTAAGVQAAMMAAEARLAYSQADKAIETLRTTSNETNSTSLVGALSRMAAGNAMAAAGKCEDAVRTWAEILAAKDAGFLHGEAALRSGLCLEKSGDKAKATEMYRKATAASDRSSTAQTAKALLRAIEIGS